jgi:Skp family chaperone for outer membrane proteins
VFALRNSTNVVMKYKDNEGDLVTIATDSELECALKNQLHDNLLRLSLFRKPKVTKASHAPVATAEEDAPAASVPSSEVTASTREDKMKKWKEMKEQKKMREEMKQMKRKLRDELKNMSDDSSSDEEKKPKDPQAMKALMEQRRKMWQDMKEMKRKMREECKKNLPPVESNHGVC